MKLCQITQSDYTKSDGVQLLRLPHAFPGKVVHWGLSQFCYLAFLTADGRSWTRDHFCGLCTLPQRMQKQKDAVFPHMNHLADKWSFIASWHARNTWFLLGRHTERRSPWEVRKTTLCSKSTLRYNWHKPCSLHKSLEKPDMHQSFAMSLPMH